MPSNNIIPPPAYTVLLAGKILRGNARDILEAMRSNAESAEIQRLDVDTYAARLVTDAPYFLPKAALDILKSAAYASPFDRALQYLVAMPTGGIRILAQRASA